MRVEPFDAEDVARAKRYHRPLYRALAVDASVGLLALVLLTRLRLPLPWWAEVIMSPALVAAALWAARLPLSWWRYRHEREWGFSSQAPRGWAADRLRSLAVGSALTVVAVGGLLALAHLYPSGWPWAAAAAGAALVVVASFVAPVVLEPIFNHFRPLEGPLAEELLALAARAGVTVRDVLVADASRRTRKANAYVSGLGRTRRVVLWDTLLDWPRDELDVVVAHELGHRRMRHLLYATLLGVGGAIVFVAVLRTLVPRPAPHDAALVLLVGSLLDLAASPLRSGVSRRWERAADRFSLDVTGDRAVFVGLHRRLARANLADLDPPRLLYLWTWSHPTAPERIASARPVSVAAAPPPR